MEHHNQETYRPKSDGFVGFRQRESDKPEFYVLERQIGRTAEMVNFCLKSGVERGFSVMGFEEISYDPSKGIMIWGRSVTIQIIGRRLQTLHRHLVNRKVKEVREFVEGIIDEEGLVIEAIKIDSDYERH